MSVGGGKQTIGYKYYLGMHLGLCHGPVDSLLRIEVDRRIAWEGESTGGTITVNAPALFGGDGREGGVSGLVDVEMGHPDQIENAYLQSKLGSDLPAFRGSFTIVLNQAYVGNNPYIKPWAFRASRIEVTSGGLEQWYVAAATVSDALTYDCAQISNFFSGDWVETAFTSTPSFADYFPDPASGFEMRTTGGFLVTDWGSYFPDSFSFVDQENYEPCTTSATQVLRGRYSDAVGAGQTIIGHPDPNPVSGGFAVVATPLIGETFVSSTLLRHFPAYVYSTSKSGSQTLADLVGRINASEHPTKPGYTRIHMFVQGDGSAVVAEKYIEIPPVQHGEWLLISAGSEVVVPPRGIKDGECDVDLDRQDWNIRADMELKLCFAVGGQTYSDTLYAQDVDLGTALTACGEDLVITRRTTHFSLGTEMWVLGGFNQWIGGYTFSKEGQPIGCGELTPPGSCPDMNPTHIIRECLTDSNFGLGYLDSDIDETSFVLAADTLLAEGMGMSILWDRDITIEDFVEEILRHIDGVLYVSRLTGKFVIKLIREDVDSNTLVLDESSVSEISSARRPTIDELTNSVTVVYWNKDTDEEESLTLHNEALRQIQGAGIATTIQYPAFNVPDIAAKVCARDLKALSTPLLTCDITASQMASELNVGDSFYLDWPIDDINNLLMRVDSIDYGDGRDNSVKISAIQDVFSAPSTVRQSSPAQQWVDPVTLTPDAATARLVAEAPYYQLVLNVGDLNASNILADDPDAGFLLASGGRQNNELNANVLIDAGAGFSQGAAADFHPYAHLSLEAWYSDDKLYYFDGKDLDLVDSGTIAQIGDELVRVDGFGEDSNGAYVSVGRGILDTVPAHHELTSSGPVIKFWSDFAVSDDVQYATGESVGVKLQTVLGGAILDADDTPADSVTMASRAIRPYPVGNLRVDGESYARSLAWTEDHTFTWSHRDRTQQTGGDLYDYTEGDIGPESGVSYTVEAVAIVGDSTAEYTFISDDVGQATEYGLDSNFDSSMGEPPEDTREIVVRVKSTRDGYDSWQSPSVVFQYPGFLDSSGEIDSTESINWTPSQISTTLWLDASDASTITEVSGAVSQWDDKSGNGRHVSQGTASARPVVQSAELDGKNVIRFDGSNDILQRAGGFITHGSVNVVLVGKYRALAAPRYLLAARADSDTAPVKRLYMTTAGTDFAARAGEGANLILAGWDTNWHLFGHQHIGSTFSGYLDGDLKDTQSNSATTSPELFALGSFVDSNGNGIEASAVDIAEVVMVTNDSDRALVEGYLAHKWGLEGNLPGEHPYKSSPPSV